MSKRFKANIDWEDSGWELTEWSYLSNGRWGSTSLGASYFRKIGKRWFMIVYNGQLSSEWKAEIRVQSYSLTSRGSLVWIHPYATHTDAKRGCERSLRRLLK